MARERAYDVGYGKPPRHTRFKKGNPGRSKGRPRAGALSAEQARQKVLAQGVALTKDGRRTIVYGIEALYQQVFAKALNGDMRAATLLLKAPANENEARAALSDAQADHEPAPEDRALIERYLRRTGWRKAEGSEEDGVGHE